jgi:hypothetical protein
VRLPGSRHVGLLLLAVGAGAGCGPGQAPAGQPPVAIVTAQSIDTLRGDFNRATGGTRVVLLLSPT